MLSDDKITHMSHVILKGLQERELIEPIVEESKIRRVIKRSILSELKIWEAIDTAVRNKLQSYSRNIPEGSSEWKILYKKFFSEEETKKGRATGQS